MKSIYAIVVAAGSGSRMGIQENKVFLPLGGVPVLCRSVKALVPHCHGVIVVARKEEMNHCKTLLAAHGLSEAVIAIVPGGVTRQESVWNGLLALPEGAEIVLVHDGARPLVPPDVIEAAIASAESHGTGIPALMVTDTIKQVNENDSIEATLDRQRLRAVQTPQAFRRDWLVSSYNKARESDAVVTDDASMVEMAGFPVYITPGSHKNMKLTRREDIPVMEALLAQQKQINRGGERGVTSVRIGQGYDVHKLVEGRPLILCGIEVPYEKGLLGHSDADVATHALMDALLGAAALGDIGRHFPDTDMAYKGASSMALLGHVMTLLGERGLRVNNVDITIVAQRPKLASYIPAMKKAIAEALSVSGDCVNIKATTTEGLGFEGEGLGISAQAVCTLLAD